MKDVRATFVEKLHECNQHKSKILKAKNYLKENIPLTLEVYETLDDIKISFIDQLIFRFSKLQDTMGDKLFSSFLELVGEESEKMTFIDKLNRLEKLELLYKNDWMKLRKDRNEIAHEYSFNQEEVVDSINIIYNDIDELLSIYDVFYNYCYDKFEFIRESEVLNVQK